MNIAGRKIKIGDALYHRALEAWGTVLRFDPSGSAEFEIVGPRGSRVLLVQEGGIVNGRRQLFWHEPLELDLPRRNIAAVQRIVDAVSAELAPPEGE